MYERCTDTDTGKKWKEELAIPKNTIQVRVKPEEREAVSDYARSKHISVAALMRLLLFREAGLPSPKMTRGGRKS